MYYLDAKKDNPVSVLKKVAKKQYIKKIIDSLPDEKETQIILSIIKSKADTANRISYFSLPSMRDEIARKFPKCRLFIDKFLTSEMYLMLEDKTYQYFENYIKFITDHIDLYLTIIECDTSCVGKLTREDLRTLFTRCKRDLKEWNENIPPSMISDFPIFASWWCDYKYPGNLTPSFIFNILSKLDDPKFQENLGSSWLLGANYVKIWTRYAQCVSNTELLTKNMKNEFENLNPYFIDLCKNYFKKIESSFNIDALCQICAAIDCINTPKSLEFLYDILSVNKTKKITQSYLQAVLEGFHTKYDTELVASKLINVIDKNHRGFVDLDSFLRMAKPVLWINCIIDKKTYTKYAMNASKN